MIKKIRLKLPGTFGKSKKGYVFWTYLPTRMRVTTSIIPCLVKNPYKPLFATVTVLGGVDTRYVSKKQHVSLFFWIIPPQQIIRHNVHFKIQYTTNVPFSNTNCWEKSLQNSGVIISMHCFQGNPSNLPYICIV